MGAVGAEPAAARFALGPPRGNLGFGSGEHRRVERERREARLADCARGDRAGGERLRGGEAELGAERVHDSRALRSREHFARLGGVSREGLLAEHMLARGNRFEHQRSMRVRRRRDGHRIDARQRQRLRQRRRRDRNRVA
ncbi:MAG: hypothetical protein NTZ61_09310, partial [Proteobacteria bacterium]|nr:hypothetical protein [Pseudomonadota bacterium]